MRACCDCGQLQRVPALAPGMSAQCLRCDAPLRQARTDPLTAGLALSLASLVLFAIGAANTLATVGSAGRYRTAGLLSGPAALMQQGLWELAALVFATTVVAPLAVVGTSIYVLAGVRLRCPPPGLRQVFRLRTLLRPWSMIEVFLVGYFVAYSRLGALATIEPGPGFYALFWFMLALIATDAVLDPQAVWEAIARRAASVPLWPETGRLPLGARGLVSCPRCELACRAAEPGARCPRCYAVLHRRKPNSLARTAALTFSALIFYVLANLFPVLTVIQFWSGGPSTILGGVRQLLDDRQWLLAAIVFVASVAIPVLKILALATMLGIVLLRYAGHLRQVTVIYRVIVIVGRWSMIDLFMESILSGLVQFGAVGMVTTDSGALAFAATVLLTILAAQSFDPRLMWDKAGR